MIVKLPFFLFIGVFSSLTSINAQDVDNGPIPKDFTCEGTLIVEKPKYKSTIPGYEKHVKKEFEDYKGKYVIATKEEIETNDLYQDKKTYPFILHVEWRQVFGGQNIGLRMWFFLENREAGRRYNGIGEKQTFKETTEHTVRMLNGNCK
ncbi:MAG TPA: hypothetical protein VGQ04_19820 [Chitinophagaceae bacterium]|jgi:hypothetical protein|nr:hypothetical protein [Chitinophagaceae bacterium]